MVIIAKTNVLSVGLNQRSRQLDGLPIRLINLANGIEAIRSFKIEDINSVISHWHLTDMPNGEFLKRLKAVRPEMPTIAIIEAGNWQQEIEARSLGVSAVICEDSSGEHFRQVVTGVLGLADVEAIEQLYAVKEA